MVEREGHAEAIPFRQAEAFAKGQRVVEHHVVGERCPFGETRRTRRVLNIDGIIEFLLALDGGKRFGASAPGKFLNILPVIRAGDAL
jgi:hypothetical protein